MSEIIPDDIRKVAGKLADEWFNDTERALSLSADIARALLSERAAATERERERIRAKVSSLKETDDEERWDPWDAGWDDCADRVLEYLDEDDEDDARIRNPETPA